MRVYVAGPITLGLFEHNLRQAIDAADILMSNGFEPYVPHLTVFQNLIHPQPYERWIQLDNAYIDVCAALLRLPGESKGSDAEEAYARKHGKPVFYNIKELIEWRDDSLSSSVVRTIKAGSRDNADQR